jgi:hypothetical protein
MIAWAVNAAEAAGTLGHGDATALLAKLDAASRHISAGRCGPAQALLDAFIIQVDALERTGRLPASEAADLRDAAMAAIVELAETCGSPQPAAQAAGGEVSFHEASDLAPDHLARLPPYAPWFDCPTHLPPGTLRALCTIGEPSGFNHSKGA